MLGEGMPIVSSAGAVGLMQLLPATYGEMAAQYRLGDNPFEPRDNIMAGAAYLRWLHHKYGSPAMFAAYNAGPGRLEDHLKGASLPAETPRLHRRYRQDLKAADWETARSAKWSQSGQAKSDQPDPA